jgi:FkbM family methyltransferase
VAVHQTYEHQQALLREFFGGETAGFFVEVGAKHPTLGSPTLHLEQSGWTGLLVEPQPDLAAFLVTCRTARVFAVACSSPDNAGKTLPLYIDGPRAVLNRDRMAELPQAAYVIVVPTRTLDNILDEAAAPVPLALLSVDVEGHEVEVLQGFDFSRWQPALILIDDRVASLKVHRYLKHNGYRLIRRLGSNGWYVPDDDEAATVAAADRWAILRQYYLALPFRMLCNLTRRVRRLYADWWAGR